LWRKIAKLPSLVEAEDAEEQEAAAVAQVAEPEVVVARAAELPPVRRKNLNLEKIGRLRPADVARLQFTRMTLPAAWFLSAADM
jgi:hypothetical protein